MECIICLIVVILGIGFMFYMAGLGFRKGTDK